jgi:hypothetical protein
MRSLVQDLRALVVGELGPAHECFRRGMRRFVHVSRTAGRDLVNDFAGGRVADLVCLAGRGLGPLAFDDHRRHS